MPSRERPIPVQEGDKFAGSTLCVQEGKECNTRASLSGHAWCANENMVTKRAETRRESMLACLVIMWADHVSCGEGECVGARLAAYPMPHLRIDCRHNILRT